jgi:hypothetical protein
MKTVSTHKDLNEWLSENNNFEDGHVLAINENPLEIIVGYNIVANYKANSKREILSFKLTPSKVTEWTFDENYSKPSDSNYIEGIDAIENDKGICLEFVASGIYRLTAESITIEEQEVIKTIFRPWVSETGFSVTTDLTEIPRPNYWKERLKEFGHNILFRYYAGEVRQPEEVPYPDYQGYYIQLADRISSTQEGIFLNHITKDRGKVRFSFTNKDDVLKTVWEDLTRILADFQNAQISCGNCEFNGTEWKQYLLDKQLPTTERNEVLPIT